MSGEEGTLYGMTKAGAGSSLCATGYVGYIAMAALAEGRSAPTDRVTVNRTLISVLT